MDDTTRTLDRIDRLTPGRPTRAAVLTALVDGAPADLPVLIQRTGLAPAVVQWELDQLTALGLVDEQPGAPADGAFPTLYQFNSARLSAQKETAR